MCSLSANMLLPTKLKPAYSDKRSNSTNSFIVSNTKSKRKHQSIVPMARLFGPAIFESSKLKVLFLGVDEKKHPPTLPRTYTLTHSDITAKLTLAISHSINNSQLQGWANRIYRDEVVAEWKKVKGNMSLHVHCHISGGHFLLDLFPKFRYYIFSKELPVVLKAIVHGDGNLLNNYPELQEALIGVRFGKLLRMTVTGLELFLRVSARMSAAVVSHRLARFRGLIVLVTKMLLATPGLKRRECLLLIRRNYSDSSNIQV